MRAAAARLSDEDAIKHTWSRFSNAWQRGDVREVTAVFDPDGDHRMLAGGGRVVQGRHELERAFGRAFAHRSGRSSRTLECVLTSVRFLQSDLAIVDGTLTFGPRERADGQPLPAGEEPFTAVMRRQDEGWSIAACRAGSLQPQ
ncbi:MAG TPA: SgcJ/EcaC family oxidoreductase [Vicinamibacterales bacterium]|nr:SgcJ/EcaC family oxidoreductase [Vicinamibacterales bacterium]